MIFRRKFIAVVILLILIILLQTRVPESQKVFRGIFGNILNPVLYYTEMTTSYISNVYNDYINLVGVKKNNEELREKIRQLKLENSILSEKLTEYNRLKKLLNFKKAYDFRTIACNVIGRNIEGFLKYIIIDAGSTDGVEINDAVVSYEGLVGKVVEVYRSSARVNVILNVNSYVSVMNFNTRTVGILSGDGEGKLVVDFYDKLDEVSKGDLFITSGLGGLYPKGIPVGNAVKNTESVNGIFQKIFVEQKVNFYKLENVLVVKDEE
ncbi:rod shape-determining protein MreC [Flexistipes sinusarabici DSM 4947]|uniref:Cell shape-determining protein MreC n=1 Tax=Flexistipes sinusarabici (strain ATCC 49648 / DSM 4947 / MAS 10) TaxID=717231 RepID=F8E4Y3_FLESM|nr:rod shape-determining protein MreC [Flexistipes sinusarabici]AEI14553.1 rod shape-determining protein MreC [Flexistipes sinusarabici DSM 4947]